MDTPRRYDEEFKRNAVELLISSGRPLKVVAKEFGVTPPSLRAWRNEHLKEPVKGAEPLLQVAACALVQVVSVGTEKNIGGRRSPDHL